MKKKKVKVLSICALVFSLLPLATFIPTFLGVTLTNGIQTVWAGTNILFILVGLVLSIICVRHAENRRVLNILSTIISIFWLLLMTGIIAFAVLLTFKS